VVHKVVYKLGRMQNSCQPNPATGQSAIACRPRARTLRAIRQRTR
jgi:hypothetical protein